MITRIISGGQTGVDRASLDVAKLLGIPRGGWCPRGRLAEDGRIPDEYELTETLSAHYPERTRLNIRDADRTLVLAHPPPLSNGTRLTLRFARELGKPSLLVPLMSHASYNMLVAEARTFIAGASVLNVAGPRESGYPGIGAAAKAFLMEVLK
jgi:hypothetical protein